MALFFALYLLLLGWVVARARYIPRIFGPLLAINGLGYLMEALRPYLFPGLALRWLPVLFFGELIFMLWLLVRGHRITAPHAVEPAGLTPSAPPPPPPA